MKYTPTTKFQKAKIKSQPEGSQLDKLGFFLITKTSLAESTFTADLVFGWLGL